MKTNSGQILQDLLQKRFPGEDVWVPGIANGAMARVIKLLAELPDAEMIRIIREADRASK